MRYGYHKRDRTLELKCAKQLQSEGFKTILTFKAGVPDVIGFKKRTTGGFDLIFREVKSMGTGPSKEQYEMIEMLKAEGIDASIVWLEI